MSAEPMQPAEQVSPLDLALARLMQVARRRPLSVADIEDLDPGAVRVELIDGNLIVTPAPDLEHQDLCVLMANALNAVVPPGPHAWVGPNVLHPTSESTFVEPDVVVASPSRTVRNGLGVDLDTVALAVEITSSNRVTDFGVKRDLFAKFGVPYVVIDHQSTPHRHHLFGDVPSWVPAAL